MKTYLANGSTLNASTAIDMKSRCSTSSPTLQVPLSQQDGRELVCGRGSMCTNAKQVGGEPDRDLIHPRGIIRTKTLRSLGLVGRAWATPQLHCWLVLSHCPWSPCLAGMFCIFKDLWCMTFYATLYIHYTVTNHKCICCWRLSCTNVNLVLFSCEMF